MAQASGYRSQGKLHRRCGGGRHEERGPQRQPQPLAEEHAQEGGHGREGGPDETERDQAAVVVEGEEGQKGVREDAVGEAHVHPADALQPEARSRAQERASSFLVGTRCEYPVVRRAEQVEAGLPRHEGEPGVRAKIRVIEIGVVDG